MCVPDRSDVAESEPIYDRSWGCEHVCRHALVGYGYQHAPVLPGGLPGAISHCMLGS